VNAIRDTIEELHRTAGVKGVSVVTLDGLVVSDCLDASFDSEAIAGLASFLLMTTNRSLREGGLGECSQFMLHATHGKVILTALTPAGGSSTAFRRRWWPSKAQTPAYLWAWNTNSRFSIRTENTRRWFRRKNTLGRTRRIC
jgi:predicted regulator of Ras-like GTPase activity (Roadblock/LC7/MglB family)